MCDHAVFDARYPFEYMTQNPVAISFIREPFSRLKSAFRYFGIDKHLKLHRYKYPLYEFLRKINSSSYSWKIPLFTKNTQMFTFGWKDNLNKKTKRDRLYQTYRL